MRQLACAHDALGGDLVGVLGCRHLPRFIQPGKTYSNTKLRLKPANIFIAIAIWAGGYARRRITRFAYARAAYPGC